MDEHFDPNDYADLSQLLGDVPQPVETPATAAAIPESGAAQPSASPVETPAADETPAAVSDADAVLAARLSDIERRLLAIEALARRNGWPL